MTVEEYILEGIAKEQDGYYTTTNLQGRTPIDKALVVFYSNDRGKLERNARLFGGEVARGSGGPGSWHGDTRSISRGDYRWTLLDREAYIFSRKILPHLARHDQYRFTFCQHLMMEYMAREGNSNAYGQSRSAQRR